MTIVAFDAAAEHRLHTLGLTTHQITRALLRADAEAKHTTGLEPPTAEGTIRYFKTVRFLREELVSLGWGMNDYKNFCRTVDPNSPPSQAATTPRPSAPTPATPAAATRTPSPHPSLN